MIPALDLVAEFNGVVRALARHRIRYALVGGLALAIHGFPRATKDIDLLIHPKDLDKAKNALRPLGFCVASPPWTFAESSVTLHRVLKTFANSEEVLMVDLMVPGDSELQAMVGNAVSLKWGTGRVRVVKKLDLIALKKYAGRPQDLADLAKLDSEYVQD